MMENEAIFDAWLKDNHPETYRLAYRWNDKDDDDLIAYAKASVLDMRTGWNAAISNKTIQLPKDPDLGSDAEWYKGYMGGWRDCRSGLRNILIAAGLKVKS